nr:transposase [Zoogloea sp.]
MQRGNNRQACFFAEDDYRVYLDWLTEYAGKSGCRVHAYVLMTNHVHLLVSADSTTAPGALMKALGQRYVQYVNRTYLRSGTLGKGAIALARSIREAYLLACQRYIELNPVRAAIGGIRRTTHGRYRANAEGEASTLIQAHGLYSALGQDAEQRQAAYRSCSGTNWEGPAWWIRFGEPQMATLCWATSALPGDRGGRRPQGQCRESRDGAQV